MTRERAGRCRPGSPGGLQAVHLRHPDVHQHHVGPVPAPPSTASSPSAASADHGDARRAEDHAEPAADQRLIVGDDHARRGGPGRRCARLPRSPADPLAGDARPGAAAAPRGGAVRRPGAGRGPASRRRGRGPARSSPPYSATRSRRPSRPRPQPADRGRGGEDRPPGVGDLHHELGLAVVEPHGRGLGFPACLSTLVSASWTTRIRGQVEAGREGPRRAADLQLDGSPAAVSRSISALELGQARLRARARRPGAVRRGPASARRRASG